MLVAFVLACGTAAPPPDPELARLRRAVTAWEAGERALAAGDPTAAARAFTEARQARPEDPLLAAWEARALAASGQSAEAIALLDRALRARPSEALLRYNLAALLARDGQLDRAGEELRRALEAGARPSREVLGDPDFQPHLGHPAFAFLPAHALDLRLSAPETTVFLGSEFEVEARVLGAEQAALRVEASPTGPAALVRAVEDVAPTPEGALRGLRWTLRASGAGAWRSGPIRVRAGSDQAVHDGLSVPLAAPDERAPAGEGMPGLPVPSGVIGAREAPAVWSEAGWLYALGSADATLERPPGLLWPAPLTLETQERGQRTAIVWAWPAPSGPVRLRVRTAGGAPTELVWAP